MSKFIHRTKECAEYGCYDFKRGESWHVRGLADVLLGIVIGETIALAILFLYLVGA